MEFDFGIFLSCDAAVLADGLVELVAWLVVCEGRRTYSGIVVGGIAITVAQISPIGAAKCLRSELKITTASTCQAYHVDVEYGNARGEVVLVKDTGELMVGEDGALVETPAARRVECTTLELRSG